MKCIIFILLITPIRALSIWGPSPSPAPSTGSTSVVTQQSLSYSGALMELESMRDQVFGQEADCHLRVLDALKEAMSSTSSEQGGNKFICSTECAKLSMTHSLTNCILKHQSHSLIRCSVTTDPKGDCSMARGCLTKASPEVEKGFGLSSFIFGSAGKNPDEKEPAFDDPSQQSIVWSQSYNHIDSLCSHLSTIVVMNNTVTVQELAVTATKELAVTARKNSEELGRTLEELELVRTRELSALLSVTSETAHIATRVLNSSESTLGRLEANRLVLLQVQGAVDDASEKIDQSNQKLDESINHSQVLLQLTSHSLGTILFIFRNLERVEKLARSVTVALRVTVALGVVGMVLAALSPLWCAFRLIMWILGIGLRFFKRGLASISVGAFLDQSKPVNEDYPAPAITEEIQDLDEQVFENFSDNDYPQQTTSEEQSELLEMLREIRDNQEHHSRNQRQFREVTFRTALRAAEGERDFIREAWNKEVSRLKANESAARKRIYSEIAKDLKVMMRSTRESENGNERGSARAKRSRGGL